MPKDSQNIYNELKSTVVSCGYSHVWDFEISHFGHTGTYVCPSSNGSDCELCRRSKLALDIGYRQSPQKAIDHLITHTFLNGTFCHNFCDPDCLPLILQIP